MFAEQQIARRHRPRRAGFADVVDVHAAAFDVFSRLTFGGTQAGVKQKFHQRHARTVDFYLFNFLCRHFADDFVESAFGNVFQIATK